jgi:diguanylate cyclase (GGDEF)-like protein
MTMHTKHHEMDERDLIDVITDSETGLLSGTFFRLRMEEEFKKSWRFSWTYTLLVIEADGLDEIEQEGGHAALESAVLDIAGEVLTASRDVDLSARLDTHRFAMLLPGTPAEGARTMVQRVMTDVLEKVPAIKLSVGLAESPQEDLTSADEFLARAEKGCEIARGQGDNQVATWDMPSA